MAISRRPLRSRAYPSAARPRTSRLAAFSETARRNSADAGIDPLNEMLRQRASTRLSSTCDRPMDSSAFATSGARSRSRSPTEEIRAVTQNRASTPAGSLGWASAKARNRGAYDQAG